MLARRIGASLGIVPAAILGQTRRREVTRARQLLAFVWVEHLGRPASALADLLGQTRATVSWAARRGATAARGRAREIDHWCR